MRADYTLERPPLRPLSPRQKRFVEEYLHDCNAAAACRRAGYDGANSDVIGHRLRHLPNVAHAIRMAQEERSQRSGARLDDLDREITAIALHNPRDLIAPGTDHLRPLDDIPDDALRAVVIHYRKDRKNPDAPAVIDRVVPRDKLRALLFLYKQRGLASNRDDDADAPNDKRTLEGLYQLANQTCAFYDELKADLNCQAAEQALTDAIVTASVEAAADLRAFEQGHDDDPPPDDDQPQDDDPNGDDPPPDDDPPSDDDPPLDDDPTGDDPPVDPDPIDAQAAPAPTPTNHPHASAILPNFTNHPPPAPIPAAHPLPAMPPPPAPPNRWSGPPASPVAHAEPSRPAPPSPAAGAHPPSPRQQPTSGPTTSASPPRSTPSAAPAPGNRTAHTAHSPTPTPGTAAPPPSGSAAPPRPLNPGSIRGPWP